MHPLHVAAKAKLVLFKALHLQHIKNSNVLYMLKFLAAN